MTEIDLDFCEAFTERLKLAKQDVAYAQVSVATFYQNAQGVYPSKISAYMWFELAASNNDKNDEQSRKDGRIERDNIAKEMSSYEIAEAKKLADDWIKENR